MKTKFEIDILIKLYLFLRKASCGDVYQSVWVLQLLYHIFWLRRKTNFVSCISLMLKEITFHFRMGFLYCQTYVCHENKFLARKIKQFDRALNKKKDAELGDCSCLYRYLSLQNLLVSRSLLKILQKFSSQIFTLFKKTYLHKIAYQTSF